MGDKLKDAINALRSAGLDAEADAVEELRARHNRTMDAYHAGQRASYSDGCRDGCNSVAAPPAPAAVPLTDGQIAQGVRAVSVGHLAVTQATAFRAGVRFAEAHHGTALAEKPPTSAVPPGMVLVPIEPTPEMLRAAHDVFGNSLSKRCYSQMIAAALKTTNPTEKTK